MKLNPIVLTTCIAVYLAGCVAPYRGDTVLIPLTDSTTKWCLQGSNNNAMVQYNYKEHYLFGIQSNFLNLKEYTADLDSNSVNSNFNNLRFFTGYQSSESRRGHRFYVIGGLGVGQIKFVENYNISNPVNYFKSSYNGIYQSAFIETGFKLYKGYTTVQRGWFYWNIDAPIYWMPHFGLNAVYLNNTSATIKSAGNSFNSAYFKSNGEVPQVLSAQFKAGLTWLYSGDVMNYFWDVTYINGNSMNQNFNFRVGLGVHFSTKKPLINTDLGPIPEDEK